MRHGQTDQKTPISKQVLSFLKRPENIISLVTILTAVILGYHSIVTGQTNDYLHALLVLAALLAAGQLGVGYSSILRDNKVEEMSNTLDALRKREIIAQEFFQTRETLPHWSWESRLDRAKTVDLIGLSLVTLGTTYNAVLSHLKESGTTIRMLILDPEDRALQDAIKERTYEINNAEQHANLIRSVISNVCKIAEDGGSRGSLQLKVTDRLVSFSYIGTDVSRPNGKITVEFHLTKHPINGCPIMILDATKDPHWFDVFRNQFELMWANAKDVDCAQVDHNH